MPHASGLRVGILLFFFFPVPQNGSRGACREICFFPFLVLIAYFPRAIIPPMPDFPFDASLSVCRQTLVDHVKEVSVCGRAYPVRRTAKRRLAQVDFEFDGVSYRALEQNPETASRWAQLARKGAKVMQFLSTGRYLAVVVDGKLTHYSRAKP